jgi:hypothetical protein
MTVIDVSTGKPLFSSHVLKPNVASGNIDYLVSQWPWQDTDPAVNDLVTFYVFLLDEDSSGHYGKKNKLINKQYLVEAYTSKCTNRPPVVLTSPGKVKPLQTDVGQGHEGGK